MRLSNGDALEFVILALATFRATRLIIADTVFSRIRDGIWKKFPPENGGIGYLITCEWCTSIWVASLLVLLYMIWPTPVIAGASILALSAITGLINRVSN